MKKIFVLLFVAAAVLFSNVLMAENIVQPSFSCSELKGYKSGDVMKKEGEFINMKWPFVIMRENGNGVERFYFNEDTRNVELISKLQEKDSVRLYVSSWGNVRIHCIEKKE